MKWTIMVLSAGMALMASGFSVHAAKLGAPAPEFAVQDAEGKQRKLSDFKGKHVVLEWHNQGCPYVKKHYDSGNMQKLQKEWTGKGVVWLTVISSAKGKQGYVEPSEAIEYMKDKNAAPTAVLLDSDGAMGKAYSAKVTPHMFVIDPKGVLVYDGAIDDKATADIEDIATSKNYVAQALSESMSGKKVSEPSSKPYGCGVKYGG